MAAAGMEAVQNQLKQELEKFQGIQKSIQKTVSTRQRLDAQLNENKVVLEELKYIEDGKIYKLIGPVLVKQDPDEAKDTVTKRIEYITKEIERHDIAIKDLEKKFQQHKQTLGGLQQQFQQLAIKANSANSTKQHHRSLRVRSSYTDDPYTKILPR